MGRHRKLGMGVAMLLLGLTPSGAETNLGAVRVTASALNVRSGPGTSNAALGLVRGGQVYAALQRSGSWVKIQFDSRAGWSHGSYLAADSALVREVTASALNVRSGPGTRYRVLGQVRRGDQVAVLGESGSWRKLQFAGSEAWVHGDYLSGSSTPPPSTRPRSSAGFIQLDASAPGLYGYYSSSRRWGTPTMIYGIERIARRWVLERPNAPRIGVGDISAMNGGALSGHASHRLGVDADLALMRNDGREEGTTIHRSSYSRSLTRALLNLFEAELPVTHIFFNDAGFSTPHKQPWPNHDNHFHVRIRR